ncbi:MULTISPECIES: hypothetical protein [unclassified Streptomyces]|uniref:hypothetical protein n=1 Tax=unclassified Streptomyces TaxID=2593676 RepID=UPI0020245C1C|nr:MULTISPECIES: hypothetical protein [unclassified Streptomyces]WSC19074.1 hypothetical protein OIE60_05005 [Streptomyces sp. NBC_01766]
MTAFAPGPVPFADSKYCFQLHKASRVHWAMIHVMVRRLTGATIPDRRDAKR